MRSLLAAPLVLLVPLVPVPQEGDGPPRLDDGRPHRVEGVDELDCAACHAEIAGEWAESLHALAWVDPHFQEAIAKKRRPESCHGCHIPVRLHGGDLSKRPVARSGEEQPLAHGITCVSCHGGEGETILGPFGIEHDSHPSEQHPSFTEEGRDALCATCHRTNIGPVLGVARDFEDTDQAAKGKSCVGCHMPVEFRTHAVVEGEPREERLGRSHRLLGPWDAEFTADAFALAAERRGDKAVLVVANQAGHRIPGLTTRSFVVRARPAGAAKWETLAITSRSHLPADGVVTLELPAAPALEVELDHLAPGVEEPIPLVRRTLEVGP